MPGTHGIATGLIKGKDSMKGESRLSGESGWQNALEKVSCWMTGSGPACIRGAVEKLLSDYSISRDGPQLLLHLAVLAAQYGEEDLALHWIDREERALGSGTPRTIALHEALRVAVDLASKDYPAVDRKVHGINWDALPAAPWLVNLRLLLAVRARNWRGALCLLRRPPAAVSEAPPLLDPYDHGNRLRILGIHFFQLGLWDKGMRFFRAALREFTRSAGIHARLKEIEILGAAGMEAYRGGRLDEAEDLLTRAIGEAEEYHHAFYRDKFRHELAVILADRENRERADEILLDIVEGASSRRSRSGSDHFLECSALLTSAGLALDQREVETARARLEEARSLLDRRNHPRYRGYLELQVGRLVSQESPRGGASRALEHFNRAEHHFATFGDGDLVGLAQVQLYRGCHHLSLKDVRLALAQAIECARTAAAGHCKPLQSHSILLKSRILLEQEAPQSEGLYEDILGNLGRVHSPALLFKVVANLYFYSWELDNHLELTDFHMRQLQKLGEILDRETFRRLYQRHVVRRFVRRMARHTFGVDPAFLEPDAD